MQQEANTVTNKSKEEQAEVEEELARMAKLVFTFQVCNHSFSNKTETDIVTYWLCRPARLLLNIFCICRAKFPSFYQMDGPGLTMWEDWMQIQPRLNELTWYCINSLCNNCQTVAWQLMEA